MNVNIIKLALASCVMITFLISSPSLAVLVYTLGEQVQDNIVMDIRYTGTPPEDSVLPYRWYWPPDNCLPIEFEKTFGSADISDGSEWGAVSSALSTWEAVPNTSIRSSLNNSDGDWGALNGDNELGWVGSDWDSIGGFGFSPDAIAVTVTWYYTSTLVQVESDIFFNRENFTWYTDTDDSGWEQQYVEHIALHELGHAFSLSDLYDPADADRTMYGYSGYCDEDITLRTYDAVALQHAYPVPEPTTMGIMLIGAVYKILRKGK